MHRLVITQRRPIRLRRPTEGDAEAVFLVHGDPATNVHNPAGPDPDLETSRRSLLGWIHNWERDGIGYHLAEDAETEEPLGVVGLRRTDAASWGQEPEPVLNLYYRFRPCTWGTGVARESAQAILATVAPTLPEPVVAVIRPVNEPSTKLAQRLGLVAYRDVVLEGAPSVEYRFPVTG